MTTMAAVDGSIRYILREGASDLGGFGGSLRH
jgi:hypothetical protein